MFKKINTLKLFFNEPTREFNIREVARVQHIAPATISKRLTDLVKEGFLKENKERMYYLYSADLDSEVYRDTKIFYNIRQLKESGLVDALNSFYLKPTIILFGSASDGMDTDMSDIDLVIISEKTEKIRDTKKYEKKLKRKIQLFVVKEIKDLKNEHLINNVLNGINIQGKVRWT